ncbi:hypothetical protein LTR94_033370, partial [Friedmanniomyces endolithicus]
PKAQPPGADQAGRQRLASRRRAVVERKEGDEDARGAQAQRPEGVRPAALSRATLHQPSGGHDEDEEQRRPGPQRQADALTADRLHRRRRVADSERPPVPRSDVARGADAAGQPRRASLGVAPRRPERGEHRVVIAPESSHE